jgi:hypothetical protein
VSRVVAVVNDEPSVRWFARTGSSGSSSKPWLSRATAVPTRFGCASGAAGADACLETPFSPAMLSEAVARLLA